MANPLAALATAILTGLLCAASAAQEKAANQPPPPAPEGAPAKAPPPASLEIPPSNASTSSCLRVSRWSAWTLGGSRRVRAKGQSLCKHGRAVKPHRFSLAWTTPSPAMR